MRPTLSEALKIAKDLGPRQPRLEPFCGSATCGRGPYRNPDVGAPEPDTPSEAPTPGPNTVRITENYSEGPSGDVDDSPFAWHNQ